MLNKYKNALFEVLIRSGIDPTLFEVKYGHGMTVTLQGGDLCFSVIDYPDFHTFNYSMNRFNKDYPLEGFRGGNISNITDAFRQWLDKDVHDYISDMSLPDYWSQLLTYKQFLTPPIADKKDASHFTTQEKDQILLAIKAFEKSVEQQFHPTGEQLREIRTRLDYLAKAVDRLSPIDWRGVAISTVIGIATNLSVDSEQGKQLLQLFIQAFQSALKLLP